MHLYPTPGLDIRDYVTGQSVDPTAGIIVEDTVMTGRPDAVYWQFLLAHGDVSTNAPSSGSGSQD